MLFLLAVFFYPALADQTKLTPETDTYVASGRPTTNFALDEAIWVGYNQTGGYQAERSLLRFNPTIVPAGNKIISARLWLYLSGTTRNDTPLTIQAYRVRSPWAESITWNQHLALTVDGSPAASTSVPAVLGWYAWDVTAALQAWSDQRDTADFSLLLRSNVTSGQHERGFWSKDCSPADCGTNQPYLEIQFEPPTPTPTPTLTPTPTPPPGLIVELEQSSPIPGQLTYFIGVRNPSSQTASAIELTSPIPKGATFISASNGGTSNGKQVTWNIPSLAPGSKFSRSYVVKIAPVTGGAAIADLAPQPALAIEENGSIVGQVVIEMNGNAG